MGGTKQQVGTRIRVSAVRNITLCGRHLGASHVVGTAVATECGHGGEDGVDEEDEPD